jgi:hypothetical protein
MPSTVIRSFSYSGTDCTLRVVFVSGRIYLYRKVPEAVARGMYEAFAKGEYFNQNIRGRYAFERETDNAIVPPK